MLILMLLLLLLLMMMMMMMMIMIMMIMMMMMMMITMITMIVIMMAHVGEYKIESLRKNNERVLETHIFTFIPLAPTFTWRKLSH